MPELPPLAPVSVIDRRLSLPEYYHASIGSSRRSLEPPRHFGFLIRGVNRVPVARWRQALSAVAAANPGLRLRLSGQLWWSRWTSDGAAPQLTVLDDIDWDGRSSDGAAFIHARPLPLRSGPTVELLLARLRDGSDLLVLRAHHAVMDGVGAIHTLEELFRALRGEALLGANAAFSDVDLMCATGARHSTSRHIPTLAATGAPRGSAPGDEWRLIDLGPPRKLQLGQLAQALSRYLHQRADGPALFAIPVNLRRHCPGLRATTNFSNMLMVPMQRDDDAQTFHDRLRAMLDARMDAVYPRLLNLFLALPMRAIDRLLSRTASNYTGKRALETATISNLGRIDPATLSCDGFVPEQLTVTPLAGSVFVTLASFGDRVQISINLPRVLGDDGRFDDLERHLRDAFAAAPDR